MPRLRVHNLAISLDGYVAGPEQSLQNPLGIDGSRLHDWVFATPTGRQIIGEEGGAEGLDDEFLQRRQDGIGATIMGRNMFGPVRGAWPDESESGAWNGWWGDDPPFHHPVFVLTHHPRNSVAMQGGTTFHFVTEGITAALERAFDAAGGADVALGGGADAVRQYLSAGLIDHLHLAVVPILLGSGERLFDFPAGGTPQGYECTELVGSGSVAHITLSRAR